MEYESSVTWLWWRADLGIADSGMETTAVFYWHMFHCRFCLVIISLGSFALWNRRCRILNSWWMPSLNWKTDERYCERISFVVNHVYEYVYRNWSMKSSAWTLISVCFDVWIRPNKSTRTFWALLLCSTKASLTHAVRTLAVCSPKWGKGWSSRFSLPACRRRRRHLRMLSRSC